MLMHEVSGLPFWNFEPEAASRSPLSACTHIISKNYYMDPYTAV